MPGFETNIESLELQLRDPLSPAVLMDGGTGTMARDILLTEHGVELNEGIWSATTQMHPEGPEILKRIASKFLAAGAKILIANNYRTQTHTFVEAGFTAEEAAIANLIAIEATLAARNEAEDSSAVVAFSQGPMNDSYAPDLRFSFDQLLAMHFKHAEASVLAGAELMVCETLPTIDEARAALQAANELGIKAVSSFYLRDPKPNEKGLWLPNPVKNESLEEAAYTAQAMGALAIGVNCVSPRKGYEGVENLVNLRDLTTPVGVWMQGHESECSELDEHISEEYYSAYLVEKTRQCLRLGARLIGGCCNVTPADIKILAEIIMQEQKSLIIAK